MHVNEVRRAIKEHLPWIVRSRCWWEMVYSGQS